MTPGMNILALETSAKAASCALYRDDILIAESFSNAGLTHSQTIMPMVRDMLDCSRVSISDIDIFAAATGPGSFTGLRIGIAAVKGMAMAQGKPCAAISTLEALAYNLCAFRGIIVPVMDARRSQVYTASFICDDGNILRLNADEAISIDELASGLAGFDKKDMILVGDGAEMCRERLKPGLPGILLAPQNLRHQRASSVCAAARRMTQSALGSAETLEPVYLRLPQAERERLEKIKNI